ncbi:MAG: DNA polymerase/3'-5' exonuclease PolX [Proteobacteria bacterium]|nr:DNA polymerase/3'-5' exonuclease PolX [Pseudomonadota bacterium]
MHLHNEDVASAFAEMAELLAIGGENPFRVRAYERAANVVRGLSRPLADIGDRREFDRLPGIGPDLAGKIAELLRTGRLRALEQLRRRAPAGLRELLRVPGLGPVRVRALHAGLGIRGVADLQRALRSGRLNRLRGFGPVLRKRLAESLEGEATTPRRWPLVAATPYAESLRDYLRSVPGVARAEIAGSYRRGRDTVADLDVVIATQRRVDLAAALRRCADVHLLSAAGPTRCTALLRNGLQVDLRLVPQGSYGAALLYFTGSREHNLSLRRRAQARQLKLNEYGLYRGQRRIAGASEQELYHALGLEWIAPELREDRGEIAAAEQHRLPRLVELGDLRGDLHAHTNASDGSESLEAMVAAARARGLEYLAITDHSRHLGIVHGLDADRLSRQVDAIDELNAKLSGFTVLKGVEVDILEDGRLALPDAVLCRLDVVVAAIHDHFQLGESQQTNRVLRALDHRCVSILAHPSARLLGERAPIHMDFGRVLAAVKERSCFLELNAQPGRLDLDDVHCKAACDHGILVSIASDAHSSGELADLIHGIRQARRGWLTAANVLNARPLDELRRLLAQCRR